MTDIACPFCQKRYPASELIGHCKECRQKQRNKAAGAAAPRQAPQQAQVQKVVETPAPAEDAAQQPAVQESEPVQQQVDQLPATSESIPMKKQVQIQDETPVDNEPRVECQYCGRLFAESRIAKHEQICGKPGRQTKLFDAAAKRIETANKEDQQYLKKVEPPITVAQMQQTQPKFRATGLNWGTSDPIEQFGTKNEHFKAVYDDGNAPAVQKEPPAQPQQEEEPKSSALNRSIEKPVRTSQHVEEPERVPAKQPEQVEQPQPKKHHRSHRQRQDKLQQLQQLQQMYMMMSQPIQQQVPQPQMFYQTQQPAQYIPVAHQVIQQPQVASLPPPTYAPKQQYKFCVYCGTQYIEGAQFCGVCGAKRIE